MAPEGFSKSLRDASAPERFSKSLRDASAPEGFSKSLRDASAPERFSTEFSVLEQVRQVLIGEKDRISHEYLEMTQKRLLHYIMIRSSNLGYRDLDQLEQTILALFKSNDP